MPKGGYVPEFQYALAKQTDPIRPRVRAAREGCTSSRLVDPRHAIRRRRRSLHLSQLQRWVYPPAPGRTEPVSGARCLRSHAMVGDTIRMPSGCRGQRQSASRFRLVRQHGRLCRRPQREGHAGRRADGQGHLGPDASSASCTPRGVLGARDSIADCIVRTLAQPFGVIFANSYGWTETMKLRIFRPMSA